MTDEANSPSIKDTVEQLESLKQKGICEFGYSYLHVIEVLNPNSRGFEAEQRAYGNTVISITSGAFPILSDLIAGARYPNEGIWTPLDMARGFGDLVTEKQIRSYISQAIVESGEQLSRQQRQQVKSKKGRAKIVRAAELKAPDALLLLGFSHQDFRGLVVQPELYRKRLHTAIVSFMTDPRSYSEAVSSVNPDSDPLRAAIDSNLEPVFSSLENYFDEWQNYITGAKKVRESADKILKNMSEMGLNKSDTSRRVKQMKRGMKTSPPKLTLSSKFGPDPTRFEFLIEYASRMVQKEKRPSRSEVKDLMHLMYAEDVDLIRVDRRVGEILKGDRSLSEKMVTKFEMLPERIEKLANRIER